MCLHYVLACYYARQSTLNVKALEELFVEITVDLHLLIWLVETKLAHYSKAG